MDPFYVLTNPHYNQVPALTDFVPADPARIGDGPQCPCCGGAVGSLPWLPPHRAELEVWGREYGDVAFGVANELLVSERFAALYKAECLTGLDGFHEVEIVKVIRRGGSRLRPPPPKYYCVTPVRGRAVIDQKASGFVHAEPVTCQECRIGLIKRWKKVVIEDNTWSGEDIFRARGLPGTVIVTQRFRDFFLKSRFNNGLIIPAEEYGYDFYPWENETSEAPQ
jgi:hypothetical protein